MKPILIAASLLTLTGCAAQPAEPSACQQFDTIRVDALDSIRLLGDAVGDKHLDAAAIHIDAMQGYVTDLEAIDGDGEVADAIADFTTDFAEYVTAAQSANSGNYSAGAKAMQEAAANMIYSEKAVRAACAGE